MGYDDDGDECDEALVLNMLTWAFGILNERHVFETFAPLKSAKENDDETTLHGWE